MDSKIILEIELQNSKLREQLEAITNDIKKQQAEMKELVKQNKLYSETTEYKKKAAAVEGMKNTQKNLTTAIKEQNAEEKRLKQTQEALNKQRQSALAVMAKEEAKQRELIMAATMEVKSEEDLIKKKNALIALRKKLDQSTEAGAQGYKEMGTQINKLNDQLKNSDKAIGNHQRNVGNYPKVTAMMVAGFMAAFAAAKQLYGAVQESIKLFIEQEKQAFRVQNAFGAYAKTINDAADQTQSMTTVGNEQYQKLAVLAKAYGTVNKDVNDTVKTAIGLSTQFEAAGLGQEQALKMIAQAQNGNYKALVRYIPALKNAKSEQEALTMINELGAKGFETATKYAETYGGRLEQVKNASGDLKETIGEGVMTGLFSTDEAGNAVNLINVMNTALQKSGLIKEYFKGISEMAKMIFEPIEKITKSLGLATDGGSTLLLIFDGLVKWMEIIMIPAKMFWAQISNAVDIVVGLFNIFKNLKDFKIQDIFNIANEAIVNLLEPITDLIGATDDVKKFFGVARDECTLTTEEYEKLNKMLFNTMDAFREYKAEVEKAAEEAEKAAEEAEKLTAAEEAEKKAKEDLIKKNEDFVKSLKAINDEYEYQMYFAKTIAQEEKSLQEKMQKTFDAYKQFFADGGYTGDELRKLQELQEEIYNFTDEIKTLVNNPELKLNIVPDKEEIEKATTEAMMVWQKASNEQEKARQQDIDEEKKAYEQKLKEAANFSGTLTEILASSLTDQGLDLKEYAKKTSLFLLDVLEKQVIAQVTATALAQPDSVATFGLTGAARAGIMIGLVKGGFSLAKALISNVAFAEKGALLSGDRHSSGGIMVNAEDGEAIINRNSVAQYKPILSAINQAGGGVSFMEQGGIAGFGNTATVTSNTNIFDGVEIVATIEDINAGLVRESKRMKIARI